MKKAIIYSLILSFTHSLIIQAQDIKIGDNAGKITFEEYEPKSTLVVPEHPLKRAKFPFIDVHNHQWEMNSKADLEKLLTDMDKMNMGLMVNLSGRGWNQGNEKGGKVLSTQIDAVKQNYPNRFAVFTNIEFSNIGEPN